MTALADKVLVLNKSWLAINVTTVRDAVTLVYSDAAQFVHPTSYEAFSFENLMRVRLYRGPKAKP